MVAPSGLLPRVPSVTAAFILNYSLFLPPGGWDGEDGEHGDGDDGEDWVPI
jgi:hypothetical protein